MIRAFSSVALTALLIGLSAAIRCEAANPSSECIEATGDQSISFIHEDFPGPNLTAFGPTLTGSGVMWMKNSVSSKQTESLLGKYKHNDITVVTYTDEDAVVAPHSPFTSQVFYYSFTENRAKHTRPFLIVDGEDIYQPQWHFESDTAHPFSLIVEISMPGTGVFQWEYVFHFTDQGALLTQMSTSGRHNPAKQYDYNSSGKVIKTTTFPRDSED